MSVILRVSGRRRHSVGRLLDVQYTSTRKLMFLCQRPACTERQHYGEKSRSYDSPDISNHLSGCTPAITQTHGCVVVVRRPVVVVEDRVAVAVTAPGTTGAAVVRPVPAAERVDLFAAFRKHVQTAAD